jgi:hypothetical protein
MSDTKIKNSAQTQVRAKLQEIIAENTRPAIGRFHAKEFDESGFISDLLRNFDIKKK